MNKPKVVIFGIITVVLLAFLIYQIVNHQAEMKILNKEVDIANREVELAKQRVAQAEQKVWIEGKKQGLSDAQIQADIDRINSGK